MLGAVSTAVVATRTPIGRTAAAAPIPAHRRRGCVSAATPLWVVLQVIGLFVCLGWVLSIVYLTAIRPQVVQHQ